MEQDERGEMAKTAMSKTAMRKRYVAYDGWMQYYAGIPFDVAQVVVIKQDRPPVPGNRKVVVMLQSDYDELISRLKP